MEHIISRAKLEGGYTVFLLVGIYEGGWVGGISYKIGVVGMDIDRYGLGCRD